MPGFTKRMPARDKAGGQNSCSAKDRALDDLVPMMIQEGSLTTQFPKYPDEELGLLKADFLGLKTLDVIGAAQDNVRRTRSNPSFDIEKISIEDANTFRLLNSGITTGVFQLESEGMQNLCRRIGLSVFEEIIALIALYRPGPMQFIDQFIEGKKDASKIQVPHPHIYPSNPILLISEGILHTVLPVLINSRCPFFCAFFSARTALSGTS